VTPQDAASGQVEEHDLGPAVAPDFKFFLVTDGGSVALGQRLMVQVDRPLKHLQPGVMTTGQHMRNRTARA